MGYQTLTFPEYLYHRYANLLQGLLESYCIARPGAGVEQFREEISAPILQLGEIARGDAVLDAIKSSIAIKKNPPIEISTIMVSFAFSQQADYALSIGNLEDASAFLIDAHYWLGVVKAAGQAEELKSAIQAQHGSGGGDKRFEKYYQNLESRALEIAKLPPSGGWKMMKILVSDIQLKMIEEAKLRGIKDFVPPQYNAISKWLNPLKGSEFIPFSRKSSSKKSSQ